jgi:hypothetical protein
LVLSAAEPGSTADNRSVHKLLPSAKAPDVSVPDNSSVKELLVSAAAAAADVEPSP